ncbi:MAG: DUF3800 domain-containing protein [Flavobacteriales bacterium]|nr:DUF3800 domain-containing protein [Flavobacteriales bacterium]
MSMRELHIWCDESVQKGHYYSDFYGGILVESKHLKHVNERLWAVLKKHDYRHEAKWQHVTPMVLPVYIDLMDALFDLVVEGLVKVRIMFRQSAKQAINLSAMHIEQAYHRLYYQFIKHSFGLAHCNEGRSEPVHIRFYFDHLPDKDEKNAIFKSYVHALQLRPEWKRAQVNIKVEDVNEVDSARHIELQAIDVLLGAMAFRLNELHRAIPQGKRRRGKRTVAKDTLYKHINKRLNLLYPGFNIGVSTGNSRPGWENRWTAPYRHWSFVPKEFKIDPDRFK